MSRQPSGPELGLIFKWSESPKCNGAGQALGRGAEKVALLSEGVCNMNIEIWKEVKPGIWNLRAWDAELGEPG